MPILILHGEQLTRSRERLVSLLDEHKSQGLEVVRLTGSELTLPLLEQSFGETSLFGSSKVILIEELHSLIKSNRKAELIEAVATASGAPEAPTVILWEKRSLTKPMLKKFPSAQVQEFKVSNAIFTWLDSLSGKKNTKSQQLKLLHQALTTEDEFFCFTMFIRQVRLLIQTKDGGTVAGPPFMVTKLRQQSAQFSLSQLLNTHHRLLEIDVAHKTSSNRLTLGQDLDLLLLQL